jgi:hypothetical protein
MSSCPNLRGSSLAHGQLTMPLVCDSHLSPIPMLICNPIVPKFYDSLWAAPHSM